MRTGGCSIQQSLTPEAVTIVKQAINLARRRGHAQVTPIHVASVMLASPAGLLRTACLKSSHSHPFQCKALELCFNVALNRLPTTAPAPILGPQPHFPTLANALMAAFKRAQAQQRRGSVESQQQPILALKIEVEQLVISILDDPSVSRVMKEAGFSSTHVKSNVEHAVALLESGSQTVSTNNSTKLGSPLASQSCSFKPNPILSLTHLDLAFSKPFFQARREDVSSVIDSWVRKAEKSSVVLVGECLSTCEGVVRGVKERVERGDVPLELRYVQFLNCPLTPLQNLSREQIDLKLGEIRCLLRGCVGRGVVLYLGDLKWVAEYWAYYGEQRRHYYCPVEYLVMGLRRLVFGNVENGRIWLMGIATFNTYMKCKSGNPSLETLLDLHALTIPAASCLDLSLNLDSSLQEHNRVEMQMNRCTDFLPLANCRREARSLAGSFRNEESTSTTFTSSSLPSWLQKWQGESREPSANDQEETVQMKDLCKKWDLICSTDHKTSTKHPQKTIKFSISSPSSPTSLSSLETKPTWPFMYQPKWAFSKEYQFPITTIEPKPELLSNPNSTPNSASSSEATDPILDRPSLYSFKEYNPENFEALCSALEKKVPWQKGIIPEIARTILKCRAGKEKQNRTKQETWLFFLGGDDGGKQKIARELAKLIFGCRTSFKSIGISSFSSPRADSTDDSKTCKRGRSDESGLSYLKKFAEAVRENPHCVFYVEDAELLDQYTQKGIRKAIKSGVIEIPDSEGEMVELEDAIVIFSCESFSSASRACSPPLRQKVDKKDVRKDDLDENCSSLPLDLNIAAHEDDNNAVEQVLVGGDFRILESVDKQIFFKIHVL